MSGRISLLSKSLLLLGLVFLLAGPLAASPSRGVPGSTIPDLLDEIMERYDTNGDGKLDPGERVQLWLDIFADQDPSQAPTFITEELFVDWLMGMGYNENTARHLWLQLLDEADTNRDGKLDLREWTDYLRRKGLVQVFVVIPVDPEEIEEEAYPVHLRWHGADPEDSPYDQLDFLSLTPPVGPIAP